MYFVSQKISFAVFPSSMKPMCIHVTAKPSLNFCATLDKCHNLFSALIFISTKGNNGAPGIFRKEFELFGQTPL